MKKDRISLFLLMFEIAAIVAMHATKQKTKQVTNINMSQTQKNSIFSTSVAPVDNVVMFVTGY